jgi:hypothetical protein
MEEWMDRDTVAWLHGWKIGWLEHRLESICIFE